MDNQQQSNRRLSGKLFVAALVMFGFGFALVPLYDVMCDVLGINGKTNSSAALQPQGLVVDETRVIHVEFIAHLNQGIPWTFIPKQSTIAVHPGQVIQTAYTAVNLSEQRMIGQAVPSVSPGLAARYFNKIECFCFNQQGLNAHQSAELPLIFYIEPNIPESITTLTLSYTLFDITKKTAAEQQHLAVIRPSLPVLPANSRVELAYAQGGVR